MHRGMTHSNVGGATVVTLTGSRTAGRPTKLAPAMGKHHGAGVASSSHAIPGTATILHLPGTASLPVRRFDHYLTQADDPRFTRRGSAGRALKARQTSGMRADRFRTMEQAEGLIEAFVASERIGRPLNTMLTIRFDGVRAPVNIAFLQRDLLDRIRRFFVVRHYPVDFIWAMSAEDTGLRLNVLLSIPAYRWSETRHKLCKSLGARLLRLGGSASVTASLHPSDLEVRLQNLGSLMSGTDPAALVRTKDGCVSFADLLRFYLESEVKPQRVLRDIEWSGQSRTPQLKAGRRSRIRWVSLINALRLEHRRLPAPDFVAERLGACSPDPDDRELRWRAAEIEELRDKCRHEQGLAFRASAMASYRGLLLKTA